MTRSQAPAGVEAALTALRAGAPVLVLDDEQRENEGDVVLAAESLTDRWLAWTVRHSSGFVCAPMPAEWADRLDLAPMVADSQDRLRTAYTVSVDARHGVTTGISAADRAHTIRTLAREGTSAEDLVRPGHVLPLRARPGGVLSRPGHTEATVDLCRLAGLAPVGAIAELVNDDGSMMRAPEVLRLGARTGLPVLTIAALVEWRTRHDRVQRVATTRLPTAHGEFVAVGYRDVVTGAEHLALVASNPGQAAHNALPVPRDGGARLLAPELAGGAPLLAPELAGGAPLLARLHSECLTGDVLGSCRCDCGAQLDAALALLAAEGGVLVYLCGQEGRGVGLASKLQAYALQDQGLDTVDAQLQLGLPVDARDYAAGAAILHDLGVRQVRLLTNNPAKVEALRAHGIDVAATEALAVVPGPHNAAYLRAKRDRLGHDLPNLPGGLPATSLSA